MSFWRQLNEELNDADIEAARDAVGKMRDKAVDVANDAHEKASEHLSAAKEHGSKFKDYVSDKYDSAKRWISKNPETTMLVGIPAALAAGAGAVALRRKLARHKK